MNNTIKMIIIVVVCLAVYHYMINSNENKTNSEHFGGTITQPFLAFIMWLQDSNRYASLQNLISNMTINNDVIQFNKKITFTDDVTIAGASKKLEFVHPTGNKLCGIMNGGGGRMHMYGDELLYVLNKNGAVVGREWGGTGGLSVQGGLAVTGRSTLSGGVAGV